MKSVKHKGQAFFFYAIRSFNNIYYRINWLKIPPFQAATGVQIPLGYQIQKSHLLNGRWLFLLCARQGALA